MPGAGRDSGMVGDAGRYVVDLFAVVVLVLVFVMPPLALLLAAVAAIRASRFGDGVGGQIYIALLAIATLTTAGLVAGIAGDREFMMAAVVIAFAAALTMSVRTVIAVMATSWKRRGRAT